MASKAGPSLKKWKGASRCVPVCTTISKAVTFIGSAGWHISRRMRGAGNIGTRGLDSAIGCDRSIQGPAGLPGSASGNSIQPRQPLPRGGAGSHMAAVQHHWHGHRQTGLRAGWPQGMGLGLRMASLLHLPRCWQRHRHGVNQGPDGAPLARQGDHGHAPHRSAAIAAAQHNIGGMPMTTRALADFVATLRPADLPPEVMMQASRVLLDAVGCAVAAWSEDREKARIARDIAALYPARPGAGVIGAAGVSAQPAFAALANGILVNAADNDDTHKRALLHVGSVVVPTALALAETRGLSGRDMLTALVAGYEVAVRVGMAVMPTHYRFWHSTATNGTFGAAASAARAMGLDAAATLRALGLAGTQAAGLNTFFESGDMTKSIHPGKAALNGVLSAQLAQLGATSPPGILEHPKGYLAAFSLDPKPAALTDGLGSSWEILQNGFKFLSLDPRQPFADPGDARHRRPPCSRSQPDRPHHQRDL